MFYQKNSDRLTRRGTLIDEYKRRGFHLVLGRDFSISFIDRSRRHQGRVALGLFAPNTGVPAPRPPVTLRRSFTSEAPVQPSAVYSSG